MIRRALACLAALAVAVQAEAGEVKISIDLSDQQMVVWLDEVERYVWQVSTARPGKCTPVGTYTVQSMKRMHYSTLYNNAPMPWSIFFRGNYAIHGTTQTDKLGSPASAGCVRLHPDNAEILYGLVLENGRSNTVIEIAE